MNHNYKGRILKGKITELSRCEMFVFGSNIEGHHRGGAANLALMKFGAKWGKGFGPQGQSYAIPTMFPSVKQIKPYVDEFVQYVKDHPYIRFLITRLGCGIAGFKDRDIAPLFDELWDVDNAIISVEWIVILMERHYGDERKRDEAPEVIDENVLKCLCDKYRYQIGAKWRVYLPSIIVRYVIDDDKFGYTSFGNFFFYGQEMYVFSEDDRWKDKHCKHIVLDYFNDECWNQGYAHKVIFAGVRTPFKDKNGDYIYTGDVVRAYNKYGKSDVYPVGVNTNSGIYAFMLDNHCLPLSECDKFVRLGTVLYNLDWDKADIPLRARNRDFMIGAYGAYMVESDFSNMMIKARLTPNFFKDEHEYIVLNTLEVEYNWRH